MTTREAKLGTIRAGIGGWIYQPWRGLFYPQGLPHAKELRHASRHVTTIEVNATYYRTQDPWTFRRWADETPDGFVFSLKASRYATNRRDLADAEEAIDRFVKSGITELGSKLGPILWQFAPTKSFNANEIGRFVAHLPEEHDGIPLRHVLEVRHPTFQCAAFVRLARDHNVAICLAESETFPLIADPTADFVYMRLQTSEAAQVNGYSDDALKKIMDDAKAFAAGSVPAGVPLLTPGSVVPARDCFVYFIAGAKERNPAAAVAFLAALTER